MTINNKSVSFEMRTKSLPQRTALKVLSKHVKQIWHSPLNLDGFCSDVRRGTFNPLELHIVTNRLKNEAKKAKAKAEEYAAKGLKSDPDYMNQSIIEFQFRFARDIVRWCIPHKDIAPQPPMTSKFFQFLERLFK